MIPSDLAWVANETSSKTSYLKTTSYEDSYLAEEERKNSSTVQKAV